MKNILIKETDQLKGRIRAPPSKSYTHRGIIAASLAEGGSRIFQPLICEDTLATVKACRCLGAKIRRRAGELHVSGSCDLRSPSVPVDCQESASTMRFLTPIAAIAEGETVLTGSPSLLKRPMAPLIRALRQLGVESTSRRGFPPIKVFGGGIKGGRATIVGNTSSQFISGLLLACPLADEDTVVNLTTPLESRPYVELTLRVVKEHGISVEASQDLRSFRIRSKQRYMPRDHVVPGDYSSSAFLMAAAAITRSKIVISDLWRGMPDEGFVSILRDMGVQVSVGGSIVEVEGRDLEAVEMDARDTPDLVPPCAALACFARGETVIYNAQRLRIKESDRLRALASELRKMGAIMDETHDGLRVKGRRRLSSASIDPHNDHRIAMTCAVAGLRAEGGTLIRGADCVRKSYPNFFTDLKRLGAEIDVR